MIRSSLFGHSIELLGKVLEKTRPADSVVQEFFRARHYLGSRDRRFIAETVYDVLRHFSYLQAISRTALSRLDATLPSGSNSPLPLLPVWMALKNNEDPAVIVADLDSLWMTFIQRPPLEAYVRAILEARDSLVLPDDPAERLSLIHSLPLFVVKDWIRQFGEEGTAQLSAAANQPGPVTVRANSLRCTVEECRVALAGEGVEATPTQYSPAGLALTKRMNAQSLKSFRDGFFEMQDEGSQILSYLVEPTPGFRIVDACAGAGGKTLHLAALMQNKGDLKALDVSKDRLEGLKDRIRRAGVTVAMPLVVNDRIVGGLHDWADAVLIDAPCTGTGTYRRNPGEKLRASESTLDAIVRSQQYLLDRYCTMVKPGGRLVYATCSLLHRENAEQVDRFLKSHPEFVRQPVPEILHRQKIPLQYSADNLMLLPHKTGTDGFFASVFTRREA